MCRTSRCATACIRFGTSIIWSWCGISRALDRAKVDAIEICHGDGITGSTFNYGFGAHDDGEWIEAVAAECEHARVAVLLISGIGAVRDLKAAYDRARAACASRPIAPRRMSPSNISRRR